MFTFFYATSEQDENSERFRRDCEMNEGMKAEWTKMGEMNQDVQRQDWSSRVMGKSRKILCSMIVGREAG